jgi:RHS repeat-associated protein
VIADGLNTPRVITDAKGKVVWQWDSQNDPFGEQQPLSSNGFTYNLRFPGQYYDQASGLIHNGFRDYDPTTGRYLQPDPIGLAGGINPYVYVGNNPLSYVDPLGLWQFTFTADLGAGALLTFGYNSGQLNIGSYVGLGEGISGSLNFTDSGCHESGAWRGTRADGRIGIGGIGADISATAGPGVNEAEVAAGVPKVEGLNIGVSVEDGQIAPAPTVNAVVGESGFIGYGGQIYF